MPKILHIGSSNIYDSPFMKSSISIFERAYSDENIYVLISDSNKDYDYSNYNLNSILILNKKTAKDYLIENEHNFKTIIFHGLNSLNIDLAFSIKNFDRCIWLFWGGEIYNNPLINTQEMYGKYTKSAIMAYNKSFRNDIIQFIRRYIIKPSIYVKLKNIIPKFKHIGVPFEEDYIEISQKAKLEHASSFFQYSYYPLEYIFTDLTDCKINGNNILVGNSSTPENNHIDIFEMLKNANLYNREVITILSYGDLHYRDLLLKGGERILGNSFKPIIEFLPLIEYNSLLKSCNVAIMNHYRQQGMGNVISLLWMGTKLFLNSRNSIYHFLKRKKIIVYSVDELSKNINIINTPLDEDEIKHNRNVLLSEFSYDTIVDNLTKYIDLNFYFKND